MAVAGIPAAASEHARVGWVTVIKSDGNFTFGTTEFDAANVPEVYTDATTMFNASTETGPATLSNITAITLLKG